MNFQRTSKIKKGVAITVVSLVLSFVLLVLVRNDFAVDINDLKGAVKKALGMRTIEEQQESLLAQLDVTPQDVFKQRLKNGKLITVVTGTILNKSIYTMNNVLVEGKLLDATGKVHVTTPPVPCGKSAAKKEIAAMGPKQLENFYMYGNQQFNCQIESNQSVPLIVFFETLPDSFNSTFEFEIHPHSGKFAE